MQNQLTIFAKSWIFLAYMQKKQYLCDLNWNNCITLNTNFYVKSNRSGRR